MSGRYLLDTNIIVALFADEAIVKNNLTQTNIAQPDTSATCERSLAFGQITTEINSTRHVIIDLT